MKERVPSEDEMRAVGVRYNLLAEGQPIPPRMRARLAKLANAEVDLAEAEAEEAQAHSHLEAARTAAISELAAMFQELTDGGIPDDPAGTVLAALAPSIWRKHHQ